MKAARIAPLLLCASCAFVRPIVASNADLADHRAVALARTEGERLALASTYLERHPTGAWAESMRAAFDAEEPEYYRASGKSRTAAIDYLAWLPRGPHAQAAFALVRSFDEHEPEDEQSRMVKAAQDSEKRLERLAQERQVATEGALEAARVMLDPAAYNHTLEQPSDLSRWLLGAMTTGRTPTRRTRALDYTIPTKNGPAARTLELTVSVTIDHGVVASTVMDGRELFTRWAEAAFTREVTPEEAQRYVCEAVAALHPAQTVSMTCENNLITVLAK
jgi:hypothetical protein